jgi:hypothetical protein
LYQKRKSDDSSDRKRKDRDSDRRDKDRDRGRKDDKYREDKKKRSSDSDDNDSKKKSKSKSRDEGKGSGTSSKSWLFSGIVVRIISKSFQGGYAAVSFIVRAWKMSRPVAYILFVFSKYYLKKGSIVDVLTPQTCTVELLDTKKLVDGM